LTPNKNSGKASGKDLKVQEIRQHSRQLVRELDVVKGVYLDTAYTFSQCHVLFELSTNNSLSLMQLSEILLIDKSNTSRTVKKLVELGLVKSEKLPHDNRQKFFSLTTKGEKALTETIGLADQQVGDALGNLTESEQQTVVDGLRLYGNALRKSRLQSRYTIRKIQKKDNAQMARVIRDVMTEFQAVGEGYSINDTEVDDMYGNYNGSRFVYCVIESDGQVVGGGGIAPLTGGAKSVCELRKMFFLPELRGFGMGSRLLSLLMDEARKRDFKKCYLETLERMWQANQLYKRAGFEPLSKTMGKTGHSSCQLYYAKQL
jgi:putative acetyltransferase